MSDEQISKDVAEENYFLRTQVDKMSRGLSVIIKEHKKLEEEVTEIKEALK